MDQEESVAWEERSLLGRVIDFPLTAMIIMVVALLFTSGLAAGLIEIFSRVAQTAVPKWVTSVVVAFVMIVTYKSLVRDLGERRHDDLTGPNGVRQFIVGLAAGFGLFSIIVLIAAALGVYRVVGAGDATALASALINDGMFPAVSEELLFRAVLFRWMEEFGGSWVALIVSSVLFGASHLWNPHASWIAASGIATEAGLMLGASYMLTRRLWLPMGIHAAWNVSQGEIYDIPVSGNPVHGLVDARLQGPSALTGGGFGLEASLIAMIIATAFGCWMLSLAIKRGELMRPSWLRRPEDRFGSRTDRH